MVEKYKCSSTEERVHKQIFSNGVHKTIGSELVKGKIETLCLVFMGVLVTAAKNWNEGLVTTWSVKPLAGIKHLLFAWGCSYAICTWIYWPVEPSVRGDALLTFGKLATLRDKIKAWKSMWREKTWHKLQWQPIDSRQESARSILITELQKKILKDNTKN